MKHRIANIQSLLTKHKLDALLIEDRPNLYHLAGFTGTTASLLVTANHSYLLVDHRYLQQAHSQCPDQQIKVYDQSFNGFVLELKKIISTHDIQSIGFDGTTIVYNRIESLKAAINAHWIPQDLTTIRAVKDDQDILMIKKAIAIGDQVYKNVFLDIQPGMKETDVVDMLFASLKSHGATDFSFDTIVASGTRSSMPHGVASNKVIEENDIVTIDFGVKYNHYCSDCTRTFFMSKKAAPALLEIYDIVLNANKAAIAAVRAGISTKEVDRVARDIITKAGYKDHFNHGTGHGLGIEIHEHPRLNQYTDVILQPNMIITIEPGIYLEGIGGVRIEDVVRVTKDGCEVLTKLDKELQYKTEGKTI